MRMDCFSTQHKRLAYARALVEVDISCPIKYSIRITLPNGESYDQPIRYEFIPPYCMFYAAIGHSSTNCQQHPQQQPATAQAGHMEQPPYPPFIH